MAAGVLLGEPALLNALVPGVAYVVAVARTGAAEDPWPARRTGVFLAALLLLAVATSGAADDRAKASLAWHMAQQMTLLFVVPLGAIAGRPDLLLRGGVRRAAGARAALGAAWLAAAGIQWIVHLPAVLDAIWDQPATLAAVHWALVAAGLAFFGCALAASSSGRLHPLAAAAYVVSMMAATDAIGLWLLFDPLVVYDRYAGPGALADQRRAGAVMFASGMVPLLLAARMAYAWISAAHFSDGGGA
jgi:cytochrome c oxidase assembly factor CtaG